MNVKCECCGKSFKSESSVKQHQTRTKLSKDGLLKPWNSGKTKFTDSRLMESSQKAKDRIKASGQPWGFCSSSYLGTEAHRLSSSKGGGYRENAGKSKKFKVLDSFGRSCVLQSSYELKLSKIFDELGFSWKKPSRMFPYVIEGDKPRRYYPDFEVLGVFFDTKNPYKAKLDQRKIQAVRQQNSINLIILIDDEINKENVKSLLSSMVEPSADNRIKRSSILPEGTNQPIT